jgi:TPR repeat protein
MAEAGGHTVWQRNLGGLYTRGEGVERDERKASAWYLRAAKEGGHAEAQHVPAQRYKTGIGHDAPNPKWFQADVAHGHAGAEYNLPGCYDEGNGVKKNAGLALKLWRRCAQHVHEELIVSKAMQVSESSRLSRRRGIPQVDSSLKPRPLFSARHPAKSSHHLDVP